MIDPFGRRIDYLRISVTDRCNLRCRYCMPAEGVRLIPREELLSFEEIATAVRCALVAGISKVRLTGGEPLLRRDLPILVEMLAELGLEHLSLSTNGTGLKCFAKALKAAGLGRVNVSLDTLDPGRFNWLTRGGRLEETLEGIEAALRAGLQPVKLNVVVIKGFNDEELGRLARFALERGLIIRFIELMPIGEAHRSLGLAYANLGGTLEGLIEELRLEPARPLPGNGPARYFRPRDGQGLVGFITPLSRAYCQSCNRVRLTADGQLRPCLAHDGQIPLRDPLRRGDLARAGELIAQGIGEKPRGHRWHHNKVTSTAMVKMGG